MLTSTQLSLMLPPGAEREDSLQRCVLGKPLFVNQVLLRAAEQEG